MNPVKCSQCGKVYFPTDKKCPFCGYTDTVQNLKYIFGMGD